MSAAAAALMRSFIIGSAGGKWDVFGAVMFIAFLYWLMFGIVCELIVVIK